MTDAPRRMLEVEDRDGVTVATLQVSKIVSDEDIHEFGEQLDTLAKTDGPRTVVIDFGQVQYLSSATLSRLISLKRRLGSAHGRLVLCGISPDLLEIFRITRLHTVFEIDRDVPEALARLGRT
jgi:anti-sigma B factor antagonist